MDRIAIGVLGTTALEVGGVPVDLSARRLRSLLATLVLHQGRRISYDELVDAIWEGRPTHAVRNTLQGYVSRTRRLLEPQLSTWGESEVLRAEPRGYRFELRADDVIDVRRLEAAVATAQHRLSTLPDLSRPGPASDPAAMEAAQHDLHQAVALWRGEPYADLGDYGAVSAERRRLRDRLLDAHTASVVMDLTLGRAASAALRLEQLVEEHPLREQLWQLWAVALVRSDRQAHALEVLARLRTMLASELGIDPSPAVTRLQEDVLRQHPSLLGAPPATPPSTPAATPARPERPERPARTSATPSRSRLVGRQREQRSLQEMVRETVSVAPRHGLVVGDLGSGKSALADALAAWVGEQDLAVVARIRHTESRDAGPELARALASLSVRSSVPLPPVLGASPAADRATDIADFLRAVLERTPVLLVVEDIQWSDRATTRVLRHLVEHLTSQPLTVLATRRPGELDLVGDDLAISIARSGGLWLDLPGLEPDGVAELAARSGLVLTAPEQDRLVARSGGNPLHVRALLDAGIDAPVPSAVVALVGRQLLSLRAPAARLLQTAAVIGLDFPLRDLRAGVADDPTTDVGADLDRARSTGLVRPRDADTWTFLSPLVHEAVLATIRPSDRASLESRCPSPHLRLVEPST